MIFEPKKKQPVGINDKVTEYIKIGIREQPLCKELLYNFAVINDRQRNYGLAQKFLEYAVQVDNTWADSHYGLAVIMLKLGKVDEAQKLVDIAINNYDDVNSIESKD